MPNPRAVKENFYPRPPRGGRRLLALAALNIPSISIHALREEGDIVHLVFRVQAADISIHALREEGDNAEKVAMKRKK